jgi:glycosyltransferase involved in cell wall biosynthesis
MSERLSPLVSVILPTYNGGPDLLLSVRSILIQTYSNFELLLIDDGSTDGSLSFLENIKDKRLKIFSNLKNMGLSHSLNLGIGLSNGEFIARMDGDDISYADRFEKQVKFLLENPEIDLLATKCVIFNGHTNELLGYLPFQESHEKLVEHMAWSHIPMPHPSWMGRTRWFKNYLYKFPEVKRAEDQELLVRASLNSRYHALPDTLLAYRYSEQSIRKKFVARRSLFIAKNNFFVNEKMYLFCLANFFGILIKLVSDCLPILRMIRKLFKKNDPAIFSERNKFLCLMLKLER